MLFGYIRDTYDWVPVILFLLTVIATIVVIYKVRKEKKTLTKIKDRTIWMVVAIILFAVTAVFWSANGTRHAYIDTYERGLEYERAGDYESAYIEFDKIFRSRGNYKDVDKHLYYVLPRYYYGMGTESMDNEKWLDAFFYFEEASDYLDSDVLADYCYFRYILEAHPDWYPEMQPPRIPILQA